MMTVEYVFLCILFTCNGAPVFEQPVCDVPKFPENGLYDMPHRGINGSVTYFCKDDYWYHGLNPRVCQANGQWTGTQGTCEVVQCPILLDPPYGHVNMTGRRFKDTARVTCDEGYIYNHPESNLRTCQGNNTWSSGSGQCAEVTCPELPNPPYGTIAYSGGRGYHNTASVKCNAGYKYTKPGSVTRTCQGDSRWSLQFDGECTQITCPVVPPVEHGNLSSNASYYGSNISITCQPGYIVQGPVRIMCQVDGAWSDDLGKCHKETWNRALLWMLVLPVLLVAVLFIAWKKLRKISSIKCTRNQKLRPKGSRYINTSVRSSDHQPEECESLVQNTKQAERTSINVHGKSRHHCMVIIEDDIKAGDSDAQSPEYLSYVATINRGIKTTLSEQGIDAQVHVTCIRQEKRQIFMDIECTIQSTDAIIRAALMSENFGLHKHNINIVSETMLFRDGVSNALGSEIRKKNHVAQKTFDKNIDFDTQYVNLKIISQNEMLTMIRDEIEQPHSYLDNLEKIQGNAIKDEDVLRRGEVRKYILIRGRAGIGKTTLVQLLLWKWAHGEWARHFKAFFLLNLRVLMSMTSKVSLPDLLSRCTVYAIAGTGTQIEAGWLEHNQKHIGFVLDGLDEVYQSISDLWSRKSVEIAITQEVVPLSWAFSLMNRECINSSTIIVTSRPFAALADVKTRTTKTIEVMGLTRGRIMEFVKRNVIPDRINMVKQTLLNRPILLSVSAITFYCAALCQVLQHDIGVTDKLTTYTQITAYITQMFIRRTDERKIDPLIAVSSCLRSMCKLAFDGLVKRTDRGVATLVFDSQDLERQNINEDDVNKATQAGIFLQTETLDDTSPDGKQVLGEFVHLCIQEFLAMAGLLMQSCEEVKRGLEMLVSSGQFNMGLLFLYGLGFNTTSDEIQKLNAAISSCIIGEDVQDLLRKTVLDIPDQLQVLQMVHESQSPQIAREVGRSKFQKEVSFSGTKLTVVDILAVAFLLKYHKSATRFCLKDVDIDEISTKELGRFLKYNTTITTVELYDDGIDDTAMKHLAKALRANQTLKTLAIESNNIKDAAMFSLAGALRANTSLQDLRIESGNVGDQGVAHIADALKSNRSLTRLKLLSSSVSDVGVSSLAAILKENTALTDLTIISSSVSSKGVKALGAALKENTSLTKLMLGWTELNDESTDELLEALDVNMHVTVRIDCPKGDKDLRRKLQEHSRIQMTI